MNRAACFTLLLALSTSLTATAGEKADVSAGIAAAVEKKTEQQSSSSQGDTSVSKSIADRVSASENSSDSSSHRDRPDFSRENYQYADYNLNVASCPFGRAGTPTYDDLRYKYRNLTDAELWKICLSRNEMSLDGNNGACACALLASPDPWRPVDTPHDLEHADEPVQDPEPGVSEK